MEEAKRTTYHAFKVHHRQLVPEGNLIHPGDAYGILVDHYNSPGRHFHNLTHLEEGFKCAVDHQYHQYLGWNERLVAWWWHDLIYQPGAPRGVNEIESASRAAYYLTRMGVHEESIALVCKMIMATSFPHQEVGDNIVDTIIDIDLLSQFGGSGPTVFARDLLIKEEFLYSGVSEADWERGRPKALTTLLEREPILKYTTREVSNDAEDRIKFLVDVVYNTRKDKQNV